jgi:hypothetical protein
VSAEGAFLGGFQGDSEQLRRPAVVRAFGAMERQEQQEAAEAERRVVERQAQAEGQAMGNMMRRRQELYWMGATSEELGAAEAEREERRQAEIAQHREALQRLGGLPRDPVGQRSRQVDAGQLLARARAVDADGYMRTQVAEFDQRRQIHRQQQTQRDIAYHEQELIRMGGY